MIDEAGRVHDTANPLWEDMLAAICVGELGKLYQLFLTATRALDGTQRDFAVSYVDTTTLMNLMDIGLTEETASSMMDTWKGEIE
jgi:hypothetical protein